MTNPAQQTFRFLPKSLIDQFLIFFDKVSVLFVRLHVSPNLLSWLGLLAGIVVGLFYALERPLWAALFVAVCGGLDVLDGKVAVRSNQKSLYGAIFDSSLDRYSEFFICLGLAYHFRNHWAIWLVFFAFLGSTMVSYTRARAEGLGFECRVGIMQRAERIVILILGTMVGVIFRVFDPAMITALSLIAFFSHFTSIQRIVLVKKIEQQKKLKKEV
jgi:phosphatidylglycerophosphate synthase